MKSELLYHERNTGSHYIPSNSNKVCVRVSRTETEDGAQGWGGYEAMGLSMKHLKRRSAFGLSHEDPGVLMIKLESTKYGMELHEPNKERTRKGQALHRLQYSPMFPYCPRSCLTGKKNQKSMSNPGLLPEKRVGGY